MIIKRIIAMLAAAVLIVAAAGCANKAPESDSSTVPSSFAEETATMEESSAEIAEESTTAGKADETSAQAVADSGVKPTRDTTRESLSSILPTANSSSTAANKPLTTQPSTRPTTTSKPSTTQATTTKQSTTKQTTAKPSTTSSTTVPVAPSAKPVTTAASYTPPVIEYGGTLGTAEDSVRIASHEVSLSTNNTFGIKLDVEILTCSGTVKTIFIAYDCYDAEGNKLNKEPVKAIVPVRQGETKTMAIASAPFETAKVVFSNV